MLGMFSRVINPVWWEIRRLKKNHVVSEYVEDSPEGYYIRILDVGKHLFYQDHDRALIANILIKKDRMIIFGDSIQNWDDGSEVTSEELQAIFNRITLYVKRVESNEMIVVLL